jgi:hypothetical protein
MPVSDFRDHIQGSANAPVTLVEYGDYYECPYCAQAYIITKETQERLGSKLRFMFRNFPVTKVRPLVFKVSSGNEDRYDSAWDLDSLLGALDEESVFSWRQNKNK